jgi:hypothetical protein
VIAVARFTKTVEDFTCGHCGVPVQGDGYTNHCPACLWSRHVDVFPGDRAEACGEMMPPVQILLERDRFVLVHACGQCGVERRNRASAHDDHDTLLATQARLAADTARTRL